MIVEHHRIRPVSIHAPTRGTTPRGSRGCSDLPRFNSRTHEGCDIHDINTDEQEAEFQFTHPRGVRHSTDISRRICDGVSIHAPTRGATSPVSNQVPLMPFQFTHPRGVRRPRLYPAGSDAVFQFTHPRGVRRPAFAIWTNDRMFQFTHPRGVRQPRHPWLLVVPLVSIHAPARGATHYDYYSKQQRTVSIHAPARGATEDLALADGVVEVSIHAPARGATRRAPCSPTSVPCFNSRTREGCDSSICSR